MKRIESDISSGRIDTRIMILPVQSKALYHVATPPAQWDDSLDPLHFANLSLEASESDKVLVLSFVLICDMGPFVHSFQV